MKLWWSLGSAVAFFFAASLLMAAQANYNLGVFDANKDGRLTSSDPMWAQLYLWKQEGRDKKVFPINGTAVRTIFTSGGRFVRADGSMGSLKYDSGRLMLERGFYLALDTTAIRNWGFEIRTYSGELLNGIWPIQSGWGVRVPSGKVVILQIY